MPALGWHLAIGLTVYGGVLYRRRAARRGWGTRRPVMLTTHAIAGMPIPGSMSSLPRGIAFTVAMWRSRPQASE